MNKIDLYIVTGNIGTGKTTTATKLSSKLGLQVFENDNVRSELGILQYDPKDSERIRDIVWERVTLALSADLPSLVGATAVSLSEREKYYNKIEEISQTLGRKVQTILIVCECDDQIAKDRVANRPTSNEVYMPTNDPDEYDRVKARQNPISDNESQTYSDISFVRLNTVSQEVIPIAVRDTHVICLEIFRSIISELQV